jgi:hypothetical protein
MTAPSSRSSVAIDPRDAGSPGRPAPGPAPGGPASSRNVGLPLPLGFILAGLVSLVTGAVWLIGHPELLASYHYNQEIIALTHLLVLGWICSVVMGTMYQLVPVALETRLHSQRLARWHLIVHLIGFIGMVVMFRHWNLKQVGHFGSVLALGVGFFVYNLGRTLARVPRWNIVATGIAAALGWLSLTILAGLFLASAKCWPQINPFAPIAAMHAHAHLGGVGFFIMLLVSVGYKLVPMFTLSEVQNRRRAAWSLGLLNAGVAGLFITILLEHPGKVMFALLLSAGLAVAGREFLAILRARRRRPFDWALRYFLTAFALLVPTAALGVVLAWPGLPATSLTTQLENVYGFLAFLGVVSFALLGMLYKIVPFLVWYASYSPRIGRSQVPSVAELYSPTLQHLGYWLFLGGIGLTSVASAISHERAVQLGGGFLLMGIMTFVVNLAMVLVHLIRPVQKPLALRPIVPKIA